VWGTDIDLQFPYGTVSGYLVDGDGSWPVLLLQEWWGVVDQIKRVADRLAASGLTVFVPDLYDGVKPTEPTDAEKTMMSLNIIEASEKLRVAGDFLCNRAGSTGLSTVGFCMGGGLALYYATVDPRVVATVDYYGAVPWPHVGLDLAQANGSFLFHYAEHDDWATPEFGRRTCHELRSAGKQAEFLLYADAGHAFCDETRPSYSAEACEQAFTRTIAFLLASFDAP
jgi:carboxymethylenebutenolidase